MNVPALPDAVTAWLTTQADQFRTYEHVPVYEGRQRRDPALAEWVLRALADGSCAGAAAAIEWVDRVRASREAA